MEHESPARHSNPFWAEESPSRSSQRSQDSLVAAFNARRTSVGSSTMESSGTSGANAAWEEDTATCGICSSKVGKRHLNRRHHCRVCGRCVCASCSPSFVAIVGQKGTHRACSECVAHVERVPELTSRLREVAQQLWYACASQEDVVASQAVGEGPELTSALEACEAALAPLDAAVRRHRQTQDLLQMAEQRLQHLEAQRQSTSMTSSDSAAQRRRERQAPLVAIDLEVGAVDIDASSCGARGRSKVSRRHVACSFLCGLLVGAGALALGLHLMHHSGQNLGSAVTQGLVDALAVQLDDTRVSGVGAYGFRITTNVSAHGMPGAVANLGKFQAELAGPGGKRFGFVDLPAVQVGEGGVADLALEDIAVTVDDPAGFAASLRPALQGAPQEWHLSGSTSVSALGGEQEVQFSKTFLLPPLLPLDLKVESIRILSGSSSELRLTAEVSFFWSGYAELTDLGNVSFELRPESEPTSSSRDAKLGLLVIPDFRLRHGVNSFRDSIVLLRREVNGAAPNEQAIAAFVGRWLSAEDQHLVLQGPVDGPQLLRGSVLQRARVSGAASGMFQAAFFSRSLSVDGRSPKTGAPCVWDADSDGFDPDCLRGAMVSAQNAHGRSFSVRDLSLDVSFEVNLTYDVDLRRFGILPETAKCAHGTRVLRTFTAPGMWAKNASRQRDDDVTLPAAPKEGGAATETFFLPGRPMIGRVADSCQMGGESAPVSCCQATLLPAVACYFQKRGPDDNHVALTGNLTLGVDDFHVSASVRQLAVPLTFAEDMLHVRLGANSVSCHEFEFN